MPKTDEAAVATTTRASIHPVWERVANAPTPQERAMAARAALELITMPDLANPVPALFVDLPWADAEKAQEDILARLIAAESLEKATAAQGDLPDMSTYVGHQITIWGGVARPGTIQDAWGAYVSLDITVDRGTEHLAANTSSAEVVVVFWRALMEGKLPFTAQVVLKGQAKPGRNQPIGLVTEDAF